MYKLIVLAAVFAVACGSPLTYYNAPVVHTPLVHSAGVPITYTAGAIHTPVVYSAGVHHTVHQTVPVVHSTGAKIVHTYKPVEQHGYQIVY